MKLADQCCMLDQAKRLKELGVRGESLFYWTGTEIHSKESIVAMFAEQLLDDAIGDSGHITYDKDKLQESAQKAFEMGYEAVGIPDLEYELCNAFNVAELGVMLPNYIDEEWNITRHVDKDGGPAKLSFRQKNEAQVRAALLIDILEEREPITTIEEVNQRLLQ